MSQTDRFPYKEQMMDLMEEISGQMYIPQLVQHFDKSMIFDTNEKVVGKWTDGRPLYQKTIVCTTPQYVSGDGNSSYADTDANISNAKEITSCNAFFSNPSGTVMYRAANSGVNDVNASNNGIEGKASVIVRNNNGNVIIRVRHYQTNYNQYSTIATLQYTKTTDAAGSYNIADENDYSTTEKIVGTWIDGKPVYQKTINFGALANNSEKQVDHGISNLKLVINTKVACINTNNGTNYVIPYPTPKNSQVDWTCMINQITATKISIKTQTDWGDVSTYVTLQYTKTTD